MITSPVAVVFDGTHPAHITMLAWTNDDFPFDALLTDTQGNLIDVSATGWTGSFTIASDYGVSAEQTITFTPGANGSALSLPNGGSDGLIRLFLARGDIALLTSVNVYNFTIIDPSGVHYLVSRDILYVNSP